MNARFQHILPAALGAILLPLPAADAAPPDEGKTPNVVLVMADDIGPGDIGFYHRQRTGKPELIPTPNLDRLIAEGMRFDDAHSAAQDHSYVPDMWRRLNPPELLIYLDVTLRSARERGRKRGMGWTQEYLDEQHWRLRHARAHCHFYLPTDELTEEQVLAETLAFLRKSE